MHTTLIDVCVLDVNSIGLLKTRKTKAKNFILAIYF